MDIFLVYSSILLISATILFIFHKLQHTNNKSNNKPRLPPGSTGFPLIGEHTDLVFSGPEKFIRDRMNKHSSEVYKTSIFGEKTVVFCGATANKFLFSNDRELAAVWFPRSQLEPVAKWTEATMSKSHRQLSVMHRNFTHDIVRLERVRGYVAAMDAAAREHVERDWVPYGEVRAHGLVKKYNFGVACALFLNVKDSDTVQRLANAYSVLTSGMSSFPMNFPGTAFKCAMKGGDMVRDELSKIIHERRKTMDVGAAAAGDQEDLLSHLLRATYEDGELLSNVEVCNYVVGMLVPAYDTVTSALTFTLKFLAELPHIYDEVFKEQMEIAKYKGEDELLSWEDILKMKYSWNVVCEAIRLVPPSDGQFREIANEFTYAGYTIPKGWKACWNVYTTHKNPEYFPDPEKFDPSRFEGSGPAPYTYVPFGGGSRLCPGKEYTRCNILVFIHNIVTKFKLKKLVPNEKIIHVTSPVPADGLPLQLQPHHVI